METVAQFLRLNDALLLEMLFALLSLGTVKKRHNDTIKCQRITNEALEIAFKGCLSFRCCDCRYYLHVTLLIFSYRECLYIYIYKYTVHTL